MNYNRLPYNQFSSTDFLSTTERFFKKKKNNNILNKFKYRPRRWSIDHLNNNKYFSYTHRKWLPLYIVSHLLQVPV